MQFFKNLLAKIKLFFGIGTVGLTFEIPATFSEQEGSISGTLTITGKWQTSADGTNWYDVYTANNAALVVIVTGTGSAVSAAASRSSGEDSRSTNRQPSKSTWVSRSSFQAVCTTGL